MYDVLIKWFVVSKCKSVLSDVIWVLRLYIYNNVIMFNDVKFKHLMSKFISFECLNSTNSVSEYI